MTLTATPSRRGFLRIGVSAAGSLVASFALPQRAGLAAVAEAQPSQPGTPPRSWIRIDPSGAVVFQMPQAEMGQGVHTGLAMVVAEELDAPFDAVTFEQAPVVAAFFNPRYAGANGGQGTGGSSSISQVAPVIRRACAGMRAVLLAAGASRLGVAAGECRTEDGYVVHGASGRRVGYGDLVAIAARFPAPREPVLKDPREFRLLGRSVPRRDSPAKLTGQATYGIDVHIPGMLTAVVARCPVFGGTLATFDAKEALRSPGVRAVVPISAGVAVIADTFWNARRARDLLKVQWNTQVDARWDSANLEETFRGLLKDGAAITARNDGDVDRAAAGAARKLEAVYLSQYLDTAPMEPMNATAHVERDRCRIWAPMQFQSRAVSAAVRVTGLPEDSIEVHTTYMGGGFGRRFYHDFIEEALESSKAVGEPVKVVRTREDDMTQSRYRPASLNRMQAALDANGKVVAWDHTAVSSSILRILWPERVAASGLDGTAVQGAANLLYDLPNYRMRWIRADSPVPVGIWRSVGDSQNAFVTQCFIDELAHAAGMDPVVFRRRHLEGSAAGRRLRDVLDLAAEKAGWGKPLPEGRFLGVAAVQCYGSYAAQVAEVSVTDQGRIKVHRVVAALDCGWVTSPDLVRQQAEGGILYGLSAAMAERITVRGGAVEQTNFHEYPVLRYSDMPAVEFHLMPSQSAPLSVGEPAGVPCIAPAVANAVFAATGVRMRSMPFGDYRFPRT